MGESSDDIGAEPPAADEAAEEPSIQGSTTDLLDATGWRWFFVFVAGANAIICALLGGVDAKRYAQDVAVLLGALIWFSVALISGIAAWGCARKSDWWLPPTVVSQGAVLVLAGYVLVSDLRSRAPTIDVDVVALVALAAALAILVHLLPHTPNQFGTAWKAVAALLPLLAVVQLWFQTSYLPNHVRPLVDVSAKLVTLNRSGNTLHLKATVTLHNLGTLPADILGSFEEVRLRDAEGSATPDPAAVAKGFYWMDSGDHEYRPTNTAAARGGLLFADEVASLGGWLGPGQSLTGETEVDVNTDQTNATTAVYSVSIAFVTNRQFETPRTCSNDHVSLSSTSAFEQEVHHPITSSVGGSFICVESEIQPRNVVADLVDESAAEETFLVLADPTVSKESVPYLVTSYLNPHASTSESLAGQLQDALKIDSENPSIFTRITAVDSWSVPDSTTTSDPIAPSR